MDWFKIDRDKMVTHQIAARGIEDERVLAAMRAVPRHKFLPKDARNYAYADSPVRIGSGQTISQPYIVALMTELLDVEPGHRVLDVGTGSGYQAAILAELAKEVHSIERHPELAETARERLKSLGYEHVHIHVGDGTQGYEPAAPYDRIVVTAAAPAVPDAILAQLTPQGRMVAPVGSRHLQHLEIWERQEDGFRSTSSIPVVFVPLIGEKGWEK